MIIGDSRLKKIKRNLFNNPFNNAKNFIKPFGEEQTEHMKYYVMPSLKERKPDIFVIHVGGNIINYKKKKGNVSVNELADNSFSLVMICRDFGVPDVVISEVLPKKNIVLISIKRKVNDLVRELFKNYRFHFISYQHIARDFLYHHEVHLTDPAAEILADNMIDYINNFIL